MNVLEFGASTLDMTNCITVLYLEISSVYCGGGFAAGKIKRFLASAFSQIKDIYYFYRSPAFILSLINPSPKQTAATQASLNSKGCPQLN